MLWLLPLLPWLAAAALALVDRVERDEVFRRRRLALASIAAMAGTASLAGVAVARGWTGRWAWSEQLALHLGLEPFSAVMAVLVPGVAAATLLYASFHEEGRGIGRLVVLLTAFVGAMELLVCAADLLTLLIGWELVGACSWALIAHHWRQRDNPAHANVAFLVTRTGDLGLFAATGLAFAHTGSFAYDELASLEGTALHLVAAGIVTAASAKSAQLPFAPWLFSAMAGPPSVSALLHSATMVAAGAFLLARLHPVLAPVPWFAGVVVTVGLATALAGGFVALFQTHSKKLLAASTSAHYGLMFVATGAGYPAVAMLHLVAHALFKAPKFLTTGIAHARTGTYRLAGAGIGPSLPWLAAAAGVCALALGGVPPLGGAWTKEEVLTAAAHHAPGAAFLVAITGAFSAAYATRFWLQVFGFSGPRERQRPSRAELGAVGSLTLATLVLSLAWIPGARSLLGGALGGEVPQPKLWETALSFGLVAAGVGLGWTIAAYRPHLGAGRTTSGLAAWLGLPRLGHIAVVRPGQAMARALAGFDDRVLDAAPRLAAAIAESSGRLAREDRRVVDAGVRAAASFVEVLSGRLARGDRHVVDAGVRATAAATEWIAWLANRFGELILDRLPEGTSRRVGEAGAAARRLQTGLAHHYYTLLVVGLLVGLALLFALSGA